MAMTGILGIVAIGLLLGMRHATDADHVIAIATIVSRERKVGQAALIGAVWGVGHTVTICMVGAAIIMLHLAIPVRIGLAMELCVGLMLVLLGVLNLSGTLEWARRRLAAMSREDLPAGSLDTRAGYKFLRPLGVGIVHGMAGSAAVALLVLGTIHDPHRAVAYLFVFGIGTIAGMMAVTAMIALPMAYTCTRFAGLNRSLAVASGLLSVGFGLLVSYQIGIGGGLFSSHPTWTPR
jgi:hypothetical protein